MLRRDFLDLFRRGATIAPFVGGVPLLQAAATLIEIPKVELVTASDDDMPGPRYVDRLQHNSYERVWVASWRQQQRDWQTLSHLLGREANREERQVATAIMQWFGTNCGLSFFHETLRMEGMRIDYRMTKNHDLLAELHRCDSKTWPDTVTLTMKGNPELV